MKKFYIAILLTLVVFSLTYCYVFAEDSTLMNDMDNTMASIGNTMDDIGDNMQEGTENLKNGIQDTAENIGNGIQGTTQNIGNGIQGTAQNIGNGIQNAGNMVMDGMSNDNNSDYTAIRTANEGYGDNNILGMNPMVFTWVVMGIVGAVIIWLIWMYAKQNDTNYTE